MQTGKYDYEIKVVEIVPPIGNKYKFAAKVEVITEHGRNVRFHTPNLGEVHGQTREDAILKMDELVVKWIKRKDAK